MKDAPSHPAPIVTPPSPGDVTGPDDDQPNDVEEAQPIARVKAARFDDVWDFAQRAFVLLSNVTDEEECVRDHHGQCQTHLGERDCSHARAMVLLDQYSERFDEIEEEIGLSVRGATMTDDTRNVSRGDVTGPLTDDDRQRLASIRRGIPHMNDAGGIWPRDVEFLLALVDRAFAMQNVSRGDVTGTPAPTGVVHELKVWPQYFGVLDAGLKTFEFRRDDREPRFAVGDTLRLREWSPQPALITEPSSGATRPGNRGYTGWECERRVAYIARGGVIPDGFCVMSVVPLPSNVSRPDLTGETPPAPAANDTTRLDWLGSNCSAVVLRDAEGEERTFERDYFSPDDDFRAFLDQLPAEYEFLIERADSGGGPPPETTREGPANAAAQ